MFNEANTNNSKKPIIYIALVLAIFFIYWQVHQFDFVNIDDPVYVAENGHIQSGVTLNGLRWAFTTTYAEFWHPLTWLSLMLDYQLFGLNAGGYHVTNLILHILSALLLFWLFHRMTGAIWPSAFVAAFFALHPLHVESVAWIAERKDVLSAFFWMLTLCLYVHYVEKPAIKRYLLVLFSFICGLMSKPMLVTLPVIMILLDYWPLKRFDSRRGNLILWQLKEKLPLFILSAIFSIVTIYAQPGPLVKGVPFSLESRVINAFVSFVIYPGKIFWPYNLSVGYPFYGQVPAWQFLSAFLLIIVVSMAVIAMVKRLPYLFVGWFWYVITILPVIGIIPSGNNAMADRYAYLPSIGISIMLVWGVPILFKSGNISKKILFPATLIFLLTMSAFTWKQCGYWSNSVTLFSRALQVTQNNFVAHNGLGIALFDSKKTKEAIDHYNKAIQIAPPYAFAYINRAVAYVSLGKYQPALDDYSQAIRLQPHYALAYNNRGIVYSKLGRYQQAFEDFDKSISLQPDYADAYYNRGNLYIKGSRHQRAIEDFSEAIRLQPNKIQSYNNRGNAYAELGQYQRAFEDFNKAISLQPDYIEAYFNRGTAFIKTGWPDDAVDDFNMVIRLKPNYAEAYALRGVAYLLQEKNESGCADERKACTLENCKTLEWA
ncbi:MAG: tetratricopeptide repeat protein, partial [Smithella sp.]